MKLIALVLVVLSMAMYLDTRAVQENTLAETATCEDSPDDHAVICRITEGIVRLVIQPSRTMRLIKGALVDVISTFSSKEALQGVLAAATLPLSFIVHSPKIIRVIIEDLHTHLIPDLSFRFQVIEKFFRETPWKGLQYLLEDVLVWPPYPVLRVIEGIVVALSQSGLPDYHKTFDLVFEFEKNVFGKINLAIWNFKCTNILPHSTCYKLFLAFESIVVNPASKFINGLMALVEKVLGKVKEVVFPIIDKLSPSKLEGYCRMVLSQQTCAKIFLHIKELDEFNEQEIIKAGHLFEHVRRWIIKHIFTDNVLSKVSSTKVIKTF